MKIGQPDWWTVIAAFAIGVMLGPIAHAMMELIVKWLGNPGH